jgi:hypothetical protein
MENDCFLRTL